MAHLRKPLHHKAYLQKLHSSFVIMEVKDPIKLFMRWANWCEQRDRHFTSGPVEDVVSWAIWLWLPILFPELSYVQISDISSL